MVARNIKPLRHLKRLRDSLVMTASLLFAVIVVDPTPATADSRPPSCSCQPCHACVCKQASDTWADAMNTLEFYENIPDETAEAILEIAQSTWQTYEDLNCGELKLN